MKREGQRRAEYFAALVEKVKEIPVAVVVGTVIQIYDRNRNPVQEKDLATLGSGNYLALCPFHADEKLGSFVVTPDKQMWYCFTENIGWSGIHFEMMYFELDFKDAVFHLARRCSLITEEEYKRQSGKKMDEKMVKTIEKSMEKPVSKPCAPKASSDVINTVYSIMPKVCGLRKEHEKQLLKARGLKKEDLGDYFTFPTRKMDLPKRIYRETGEMMAKRKFGKPLRELDESIFRHIRASGFSSGMMRGEFKVSRSAGMSSKRVNPDTSGSRPRLQRPHRDAAGEHLPGLRAA